MSDFVAVRVTLMRSGRPAAPVVHLADHLMAFRADGFCDRVSIAYGLDWQEEAHSAKATALRNKHEISSMDERQALKAQELEARTFEQVGHCSFAFGQILVVMCSAAYRDSDILAQQESGK